MLPRLRASKSFHGCIPAPSGTVRLLLGAKHAALWARKITSPPTLAEKLGLKAGLSVWLVGNLPPEITAAVEQAGASNRTGEEDSTTVAARSGGLIFIGVESIQGLAHDGPFFPAKEGSQAVWLVYRKGPTGPGEARIMAAARASGLRDTKVSKVSDTHTALRFIRPRT